MSAEWKERQQRAAAAAAVGSGGGDRGSSSSSSSSSSSRRRRPCRSSGTSSSVCSKLLLGGTAIETLSNYSNTINFRDNRRASRWLLENKCYGAGIKLKRSSTLRLSHLGPSEGRGV